MFLVNDIGNLLMKVCIGMEKVKSLKCLSRFLPEVLGCAPARILMIFCCKMKIFTLSEELPPKIILYYIME